MVKEKQAVEIIARLALEPHPEGGWYRQTWSAPTAVDGRPTATSIHFLLDASQTSHWHRVDAEELWFWHAGAAIELAISPSDHGPTKRAILGGDVLIGQSPQLLIPTGHWQAARPLGGWALVSCVVSPGFQFSGFELAPLDWEPA